MAASFVVVHQNAKAAGLVLAGGRSTRMGAPKASLEWHGSTLLYRAAALLARVVDGPVVVVAAPGQQLPELPAGAEVDRRPRSRDLARCAASPPALPRLRTELRLRSSVPQTCRSCIPHSSAVCSASSLRLIPTSCYPRREVFDNRLPAVYERRWPI
jgi:hypothetical protein